MQVIVDSVIEQKFRLMSLEVKVDSATDYICPNVPDNYLSKFLGFKKAQIQASEVAQFRLMLPSPLTPGSKNKYPTERVIEFMETVANAGFGTVVAGSKIAGSKRKCTTFQKHAFEDLGEKQKETRKRPTIHHFCSDDLSSSSFLLNTSDTSSTTS